MAVVKLEKSELVPTVSNELLKTEVLLDIGCGIMPQTYVCPLVHICCEPFPEYVKVLSEKIKQTKDHVYIVINASWEKAITIFPEKSVDSVFLIDVIEHIEKETALKLLEATEKICRHQIVIFTPLGFLPQEHPDGIDSWGLHGGHMQEHKSGWTPEDFNKEWDVYYSEKFHGCNNLGEMFEIPYGALFAIRNLDKLEMPIGAKIIAVNSLIRKLNYNIILTPFIIMLKGIWACKAKLSSIKVFFKKGKRNK